MHIYFSGIGGTGIGPLALIAKQAGYSVSGSDKQNSKYIEYLKSKGIVDIHIGQSEDNIKADHERKPIDWLVYSSAVAIENPDHPEIKFARDNSIKNSKRDELLNLILDEKKLKLIAVAGTHGKTTTTAMVVWLFKQLGKPVSYILPAKTSFAEMGEYNPKSEYFIYEADEFDRNFLAFAPHLSVITGVSWDHHEIFPTREDYQAAFRRFIDQSEHTFIWQEEIKYLRLDKSDGLTCVDSADPEIDMLALKGKYNRLDAWLAAAAVMRLTDAEGDKLIAAINRFPGLARRMEQITPNLYSDYAHTPEKIRGALSAATEMAAVNDQKLVVVYEPLTNRRQHYIRGEYKDLFLEVKKLYWVPSYLAREDDTQALLTPLELIQEMSNQEIAEPAMLDSSLKQKIEDHLKKNDLVVCISGGGGGSLDEWLRKEFGQ